MIYAQAPGDVDACLVPEKSFSVDALLRYVNEKLDENKDLLVAVTRSLVALGKRFEGQEACLRASLAAQRAQAPFFCIEQYLDAIVTLPVALQGGGV